MIEVYHTDWSVKLRDYRFEPTREAARRLWLAGKFRKVAEVDTDDLEEAFRLTNSEFAHWSENEGVTAFDKMAASTSPGDAMVANGKLYMVDRYRFSELGLI